MPLRPTLEADLDKVAELVAGLIDSYRMVKQFIHADGHRIWGDLAVGCLRRDDRSIEVTIGQIVEITAWHPASATVFPTGTPLGASDVTRFSSLLPGMPSMDQVTRVAEKIIATPPNRSALAARPSWSPSASGPYSQRGTGRIEEHLNHGLPPGPRARDVSASVGWHVSTVLWAPAIPRTVTDEARYRSVPSAVLSVRF